MGLRVLDGDKLADVEKVVVAASTVGAPLTVSIDPKNPILADVKKLGTKIKEESLDSFLKSIPGYERIRTLGGEVPVELWKAAAAADRHVASQRPLNEGRLELINYLKEQSISFEYHRYGSMPVVPEDK